jgi:hypothetical protein
MKMKGIFILLLTCFALQLTAQQPTLRFNKQVVLKLFSLQIYITRLKKKLYLLPHWNVSIRCWTLKSRIW